MSPARQWRLWSAGSGLKSAIRGRISIPPDGGLLIYTDGLPDSISGDSPEDRVCRALDTDLVRTMANLKALVDPRFNEDDITVLLVKRTRIPAC